MGSQGCKGFVAFILKLLNIVQAFIGVAMILYAIWMLNHWKSHVPNPPSPVAPTPSDGLSVESMMSHMFVGQLEDPLSKLPATWFIYIFLGVGIIVCIVTFISLIAAEITNGCCLSCYSALVTFLILRDAALVGYIRNHHWEKDIPDDPTGEFENMEKFIKDNVDICKWVGLAIVIIQMFSFSLAIMHRIMVATRNIDYDSDDCMIPRGSKSPAFIKQSSLPDSTRWLEQTHVGKSMD